MLTADPALPKPVPGAALLAVMPPGEHHVRAIAGLVAYADPIGETCQLSGGTISHERVCH